MSYVIAIGTAIGVGIIIHPLLHTILTAFIVDVIATVIIFIISVFFKNTSLYDPYWSLIPIFLILYWLITADNFPSITFRQIVILALVSIWGVRLTFNWIRGWKGLNHEDWRYTKFRAEKPSLFWFINFTGLQMMPTLLVFLGCVPIYYSIISTTTSFSVFDIIGIVIVLGSIILETVADEQLRNFIKIKQKDEVMTRGIWSVTRHPNYFGEVSFWWGLFFFAITTITIEITTLWVIIGPIGITILFLIVSIPLMENRLMKKYSGYNEYKSRVSVLIPWFKKRN
ncbi:MAG: DUF1295 domain-containing protein [Candidatus Heimdallarchaeota archaeon]|nr:DUF1295 domain-containing protein [Candidatus Heimdallarchaeota archaeon]